MTSLLSATSSGLGVDTGWIGATTPGRLALQPLHCDDDAVVEAKQHSQAYPKLVNMTSVQGCHWLALDSKLSDLICMVAGMPAGNLSRASMQPGLTEQVLTIIKLFICLQHADLGVGWQVLVNPAPQLSEVWQSCSAHPDDEVLIIPHWPCTAASSDVFTGLVIWHWGCTAVMRHSRAQCKCYHKSAHGCSPNAQQAAWLHQNCCSVARKLRHQACCIHHCSGRGMPGGTGTSSALPLISSHTSPVTGPSKQVAPQHVGIACQNCSQFCFTAGPGK